MKVLLRLSVLVLLSFCLVQESQAMIFISEILADPATSLAGDANNDGVSSSTSDEFVELFNNEAAIDISGWSLKDALSTRHVFPSMTILNPNQFIVIFGGGSPNLPGIFWQTATTGQLSLNNTAETVSLLDNQNQLIDQVIYGALANQDQSIVKVGDTWVLHSSLSEAQGKIFSPGEPPPTQLPDAHVPELPSISLMVYGLIALRSILKR
jgi:hypothetical protein